MKKKFDIMSLLKISLFAVALACNCIPSSKAAEENSLIQGAKQIDQNFESLKEKHPEWQLNNDDKTWYLNNYKLRENFESNLTSENLQKIREEAKVETEKSKTPKKSYEEEQLEKINNEIQALEEKEKNKTITADESQHLTQLIISKNTMEEQVNLLRFNKGETTENVSNRKGGGDNSIDFCQKCLPKCYYKALQDCTFCDLFRAVFNTASRIGKLSIDTLSGSVIKVVIIAFAIWIAIQILGFVSAIETRDFKDLATSLLQQGFIVALVVILLQTGASSFFNLALKPIFTTGMNIAEATISPPSSAESAKKANESLKQYAKKYGMEIDEKMLQDESNASICQNSAAGIDGYDTGALPPEMGQSIICTMTLIQNRAAKVKAIGSALVCQSWKDRAFIIPHLGYLMTGIGFWLGGMIIIVALPFLMIDAVLELAVAVALLPAAIGAYAFKITRKYVKSVWDTFINSMFVFIFVSLIALMLTTAFGLIIAQSFGDTGVTLDSIVNAGPGEFTFEELIKNMGWFTVSFLKVCFVLILTWTVMGEAKDFAGQFSGSLSSTAIGSSVGTMGASFAKSAAMKVGKPVAEAAGEHLWKGAKRAGALPAHAYRRAIMNVQGEKIKRNGVRSVSANGTVSYTYKNKTLSETTDGAKMLSISKERKTHNMLGMETGVKKSVKIKNADFSIKTSEFKHNNGMVYSRDEVHFNSNARRDMFNKKGKFGMEQFEKLLGGAVGSEAEQNKFKIIAAKQALKQAMPMMRQDVEGGAYVKQEAIYEDGKFVGYVEIHPDGSKTEVRLDQMGTNGRVMVDFKHTDANGQGMRLTTDGVINRKQKFKTSDGTIDGEVDEKSVKSIYAMSAYYHVEQAKRLSSEVNKGLSESLFGEEERKTAMKYVRSHDEYRGNNMYEFKTEV